MELILSNYNFRSISKDEFSAFSETITHGIFLQTVEMAELLDKTAWSADFVGVFDDEELVLAALLSSQPMTGGLHIEMQYGPIYVKFDSAVQTFFYKALQNYAKEQKAMELLIIPNENFQTYNDKGEEIGENNQELIDALIHLGYEHTGLETGYNKRGESTWHYVKDLSNLTNEKELLKSYAKNGQYSVKKSKQFGIKVRALKFDELNKFTNIIEETSERRGFKNHGLDYYQNFYNVFGDKAEFLVAEVNFLDYKNSLEAQIKNLEDKIERANSPKKAKQKAEFEDQLKMQKTRLTEAEELLAKHGSDDIVLAGSLFVYGKTETIYLFSGSYEEFKKLYAPFVIQDEVMKKSIEKGIKTYNFFGVQGIFDGSDGVLHFKQNFAGYLARKIGYFYYYPNPTKYKMFDFVKKVTGRK